jgi:transposase
MPHEHVINDLLLPELKLLRVIPTSRRKYRIYQVEKVSEFEVCPKCFKPSKTVYDHVAVTIRDTPLRNKIVVLKVRKRRFLCNICKKVFREPVAGIFKGFRTTQRYRKHIMWSCSNFSNLKRVAKYCHCSEWLVHKAHYQHLHLETKKYQTPWSRTIGIDEHSFMRKFGRKGFVTVFVDYNLKKVREVAYGRTPGEIFDSKHILDIPGRENVKNVVMDLSPSFRSVVRDLFPNAMITADKFHVIKLLFPAIMRYKREVIGSARKNPFKNLLLKNRSRLLPHERAVLDRILEDFPTLRDLYTTKQAIHSFYQIKGYNQASRALTKLTDWLAYSKVPELQTFRSTLKRWREEILNYFKTHITNARTEGYNRKAKLIQRNAYGFKNFNNYRLKVLYACC